MYKSRLDDIPILRSRPDILPAARYNRARLALRRLENPLRFPLPGLKGLDLILEDQAWAVVDRTLNDIPVLAWTGFEKREALHQNVACRLNHYHAHADLIVDSVLRIMDTHLAARLRERG